MLLQHPHSEQIAKRIATIASRSVALQRTVFRSTEPAYANTRDLLTGEGSRLHGGRWNPPGSFAAVYAAFTDLTALAESRANHLYFGWNAADALPRMFVAIDVQLARVLDLTAGTLRQALGISAERMRADDWRAINRHTEESLTQAIGRAL